MNRQQLNSVVLAPVLSLLTLLFTLPAQADNRVFLSTSLEASQASYLLEFSATTGGTVDKFRLTFPDGTLGAGVGLVNLLIDHKAAKTPVVTSIDPNDPDVLLLDVPKTTKIKSGVQLILELSGLTNPIAGVHHIDIELIDKKGVVLEMLAPIPLSILPLSSGPESGDITAVTAGVGLTGGGTTGDVTLNVDTTQIQKRVTGTCAAGNAIQSIDATGNVVCQSAGSGAGSGWSRDTANNEVELSNIGDKVGIGTTSPQEKVHIVGNLRLDSTLVCLGCVGNAALAANSVDSNKIADGSVGAADVNSTQVQLRVTGVCAAGSSIRQINVDGTVVCEIDDVGGGGGGVTEVTASLPLESSGGATPNISLPHVIIDRPVSKENTAVGFEALAVSTGFFNTAMGFRALTQNTTGDDNTAVGYHALVNNTTGSVNTASGVEALKGNTTGNANTASGVAALRSNTTGEDNTATGVSALFSNITGNNNTATGSFALFSNITGNNNTATGANALVSNTTGNNNTAGGFQALSSNTIGLNNTANGANALLGNTGGDSNTASGASALQSNTDGSANTAMGATALRDNTIGNRNTAAGADALRNNSTGTQNTAIGVDALRENTTHSFNTAVGDSALAQNNADINTAVGYHALLVNGTGGANTAVGSEAGLANSTGQLNSFFGSRAGVANVTGSSNTFVGSEAGQENTTGGANTFVGDFAGIGNTTGNSNSCFGSISACGGGDKNTAIGAGTIVGGSNNTAIGASAKASSSPSGILNNATAIGAFAEVRQSNSIVLGGTSVSVGIGVKSPGFPLHMASGAFVDVGGVWTNASDRNIKENFVLVNGGEILEKITRLPVYHWNYKRESDQIKHIGPTAQDFRAAFGMGRDDKTISTIDPSGVALVAIQQLEKQSSALREEVKELRSENTELRARLERLEQLVRERPYVLASSNNQE